MHARSKWTLDRTKYLTPEQTDQLIKTCKAWAELDASRNRHGGLVTWMLVHIGLGAGLRVAEIADLRVGDVRIGYGESQIVVRCGKGGKRGEVIIGEGLKKHLKAYIRMKKEWGEDVSNDAPLLVSEQKRGFTTRALQVRFKVVMKRAGLPAYFSVHSLRHTLGTLLLGQSKNLRLVQKQLRHSDIGTTCVYADVQDEEIQSAMDGLV